MYPPPTTTHTHWIQVHIHLEIYVWTWNWWVTTHTHTMTHAHTDTCVEGFRHASEDTLTERSLYADLDSLVYDDSDTNGSFATSSSIVPEWNVSTSGFSPGSEPSTLSRPLQANKSTVSIAPPQRRKGERNRERTRERVCMHWLLDSASF